VSQTIEFVETDPPRELEVSAREARALRRTRHALAVDQVGPDRVKVGPRTGYAGTLLLPTGRRIVVSPKAQVADLSMLLALAYRTLAPPAAAGVAQVAEATPSEWLLLQLVAEVENLLGHGLRRGYVERREQLPFVRGRIRPLLNPARLPLLDCEYADFVLDTPENRLVRGTLELLAPGVRHHDVRGRMDDTLARFAEVTLARPSPRSFERVVVTRLNQHYQPALRLCRLALEGAGVEDHTGADVAPAFFVPMWRVWEAALASALRDAGIVRLHEQPSYSDRIVYKEGSPALTVGIHPDLVVGSRAKPRLVIEAKWRPALVRYRSKLRLRNDHLYQLATYATALACDGVLLYPRMGNDVDATYEFNGHKLRLKTVDLAAPELGDLVTTAAEIAQMV
jgi:5-methylcytosine-specific restriction enzyme subunit McrC